MPLVVRREISREGDPMRVIRTTSSGGRRVVRVNTIRRNNKKKFRKFCHKIAKCIGEKKYFNLAGTLSATAAGSIIDLSAIAQGQTDSTREGDQLTLTSVLFKHYWQVSTSTGADLYNIGRVIIFQWFPATTPTVGDILFPFGTGLEPLGYYYHDTRYNYRILYDSTSTMTQSAVGVYNENSVTRVRSAKILKFAKNIIQYSAATTTGAYKIWMLAISDSNVVPHPVLAYASKVNYKDS